MFGANASDSNKSIVKIWIILDGLVKDYTLRLKIIEIIADFIMNLFVCFYPNKL